jgi:predicted DNA-binding protein
MDLEKMRQLLVKLSEEDYKILEEYCRKTGRTKSAVIRREISRLKGETSYNLLHRKIKRISPGKGKLVSKLIREMRD